MAALDRHFERSNQRISERLDALSGLLQTAGWSVPSAAPLTDGGTPEISAPTPAAPTPFPSLTPRENEVLSWVLQGKTSHEIAIILGSARRTVEKHIQNVFRKTGVSSRKEIILRYGSCNPPP